MAKPPTPTHQLVWSVITIPLKAYPAARENPTELVNLHAPCALEGLEATRSQQSTCDACQAVVPKEETVKGSKGPDGRDLLFTPAELEALASEKTKKKEAA